MECRQGEIWLANLHPQKGTEPGKIRPVIILQTDDLNSVHPSTIICPSTTNVLPQMEVLRVHLPKGSSGVEQPSDILIDQIRAIDGVRLLRRLGHVDQATLEKVRANIQILLDLLC
jgi:mRNA interferase MazF